METPGFVDGRHYTKYVDDVRTLKRTGQFERAIALLLRLVDATEAEAAAEQSGVAPWYYEQLAIIYAKTKQVEAEIKILERYASQRKAPGAGPSKLAERLALARRRRPAANR
jgi:hypothetical protein